MLFSSITFLYFFLPLVIFLYYIVPAKGRNFVLFIMSIVFYAWGEPVYVLLMLAQILCSYILTGLMEHFRDRRAGRVFYILSVLLPFIILFYFKYFNFFAESLFNIKTNEIALPIGISFYTFQIASYCIDIHRRNVKWQKNIIVYATYVTLFPQLVAGPIVRYSDIEDTLVKGIDLSKRYVNFERGIIRFVTGLGKKVLMANVLGEFVAEATALDDRTLLLSWAYAIAVSLQIYFDFSGYSDMAIGLGSMLGFHFPENFRYPFISKSISEFWRRWHMTLGGWFKDYVYIPMGGSRVSTARWIVNVLVVWLFTGLWHGAGWNFILWGLMFAVLLVFEKIIGKIYNKGSVNRSKVQIYAVYMIKHVYVVVMIIISFLVFHNESLLGAAFDIQSLIKGGIYSIEGEHILRNRIGILLIGLVGSTPLPICIWKRIQNILSKKQIGDILVYIVKGIFTVVLLILCTAYLIDGSYNPFLYFRF